MINMTSLERIGLKEKEAKVYIALLKEGPSLANKIAKTTNILRSSIYDYFDVLLEKGFISYTIKSGKKYFQAVSPSKILDNFEENKKNEESALKQIIPELASLMNSAEKKANVEVFEGKEGMKTAMSYALKNKPKEILVYGSSGVGYKILPYYLEHWHNERIKLKIPARIIYNKTKETEERLEKGPSLKLMHVRFSQVHTLSLTGTLIFGNFVLITMWNPETPLAILIESKEIARDYRDNFEILWKTASKQ
jgi:sugar-specific transcriptional regulator TrmB